MGTLTKKQTVLHGVGRGGFVVDPDDDEGDDDHRQVSVFIPEHDFEDMGCPSTITVTIEPGDRLNDEG